MSTADLVDDLLAPAVNADPHPYFATLRERAPVHYSARHRAWIISRYDDCSAALMDFRGFSSDRVRRVLDVMPAERRGTAGPVYDLLADWMVVTDPPEHRRLRRLAAGAFSPRRIAAMETRIQEIVDDLLDEFVAHGHQDLIAHLTYPLPATVIAELIGAPQTDTHRFRAWSVALSQVAFGSGDDARHGETLAGLEQMSAYFRELVELRRADPQEDMISDLLAGDPRHGRLDDEEIVSMCALMLFAGHETTTSTIASAVLTLLQHPDQLELLRTDPDALAAGASEEALRYEGAIKVLQRWVVSDVELHGRTIPAGERLFVLPAAANRDPRRFDDPERLDITRSPNPHIAFGKGVHACIGAQLARLEMRIAIAAIVRRLPGLRLAHPDEPQEWTSSLASRGLERLLIAHDATA